MNTQHDSAAMAGGMLGQGQPLADLTVGQALDTQIAKAEADLVQLRARKAELTSRGILDMKCSVLRQLLRVY